MHHPAEEHTNNQDRNRQVRDVTCVLGIAIDLMGRNEYNIGKGTSIETGNGKRQRTADIVGEISVEVIDLNTNLNKLISLDTLIKISLDRDDSNDTACLHKVRSLAFTGLLQAERTCRTHTLIEFLRVWPCILHNNCGRSMTTSQHKQAHQDKGIQWDHDAY